MVKIRSALGGMSSILLNQSAGAWVNVVSSIYLSIRFIFKVPISDFILYDLKYANGMVLAHTLCHKMTNSRLWHHIKDQK